MSENRKLWNAIISFVMVGLVWLGGMYLMDYWMHEGVENNNLDDSGNVVGALIISTLIVGLIIYFVIKYLVSDTFKYQVSSNIRKKLRIRERRLEYQRLLEYTEQLEVLYGELSHFHHDYLNILTSLESGIQENDMVMVRQVYNQVIFPTRNLVESNEYVLGQLRNLNIPAIKSILSVKIMSAQRKGIKVKVELEESIDYISLNLVDFCRIFSILLDNAIEAAWDVQEPYVGIAFVKMNDLLHVVLENNCRKSGIDTEKIFEKGMTSKGGNRGIGLYLVKRILRDYPYSMLETYCEGGIFKQTLILKDGDKK